MLYIVHSCSYTILHGVCLWESDDNTSLTDYDIITSICDCMCSSVQLCCELIPRLLPTQLSVACHTAR